MVGVILGGLINAYFSWRGSKDVRRQAGEPRQTNYQLVRFLEDAGMIQNVDWKNGKPVRIVSAPGIATGRSSASAVADVVRKDNQDNKTES